MHLHVPRQNTQPSNEVNLILEDPNQSHLHVVGQHIEPADPRVGSLLDLQPCDIVVTGEDHLKEVRKGQVTVAV